MTSKALFWSVEKNRLVERENVSLERHHLRFGDVATATVSLFLITILISYPLEVVLVSVFGLKSGPPIAAVISVLLGALVVGYFLSGRITGGKYEVFRISAFFAMLMLFSIILNNAVLGQDFSNWVHESYLESNPGASLTSFEWFLVGGLIIGSQMFMNVIILFVCSFIGLFAGSRLKRQKD